MTLVIAEAGVNHNGNEEMAFQLVDAAVSSGADIVKFQTFKANKLVTASAQQADYQQTNTGIKESQLAMLSRLELSYDTHHQLVDYCQNKGVEFLSTAFDSESLRFLTRELGITRLKIPSGDITNLPLVLEHAQLGKELIVSTGMANLTEIENALATIAFGMVCESGDKPSLAAFQEAYFSEEGKSALKQRVTILHCTTEYPAPMEDINLQAMDTIAEAFRLTVGYSDHSEGITIPVAAVARGAKVIEKHFTLSRTLPGPDHKASLEPDELTEMVQSIRRVERALGDGIKGPRPSEVKNKAVARKSLIAAKNIARGEIFDSANIDIRRPGNGMSPATFWDLTGKTASRDYKAGDLILE
ncbi:MAG: N-acetylneuraminate synthase [Aestuariibacter sp.]